MLSHIYSNRLSEIAEKFVTEIIDTDFLISVAVKIEVLSHHEIPDKMPFIEEFIGLATVLPLDDKVAKKAIELRRTQRKLKLADAIIAATAIVYSLTLVTNNTKDFKDIQGLDIIDPHKL